MPTTGPIANTVERHPGADYERPPGSYDETVSADGGLRPHWQGFFEQMDAMGLPDLRRRWEEAKHLIRENGVTYNIYGDPRGMGRPWELDPIPLLIEPGDARAIEGGLIQRATLFDRLLADLYGPQTVLTGGILPPELIFGHSGYLRPCQGLPVPGGRYLHLYAADLGRADNGAYFVLRDRTQAPSGGLRPGKPDRHVADASRDFPRMPRPALRLVLPGLSREPPLDRPLGSR